MLQFDGIYYKRKTFFRTVFFSNGNTIITDTRKLNKRQEVCFFNSKSIKKRDGFNPSDKESPLQFSVKVISTDNNLNFDGKLGVLDARKAMSKYMELEFQNGIVDNI